MSSTLDQPTLLGLQGLLVKQLQHYLRDDKDPPIRDYAAILRKGGIWTPDQAWILRDDLASRCEGLSLTELVFLRMAASNLTGLFSGQERPFLVSVTT
jgi:hypothetical protein